MSLVQCAYNSVLQLPHYLILTDLTFFVPVNLVNQLLTDQEEPFLGFLLFAVSLLGENKMVPSSALKPFLTRNLVLKSCPYPKHRKKRDCRRTEVIVKRKNRPDTKARLRSRGVWRPAVCLTLSLGRIGVKSHLSPSAFPRSTITLLCSNLVYRCLRYVFYSFLSAFHLLCALGGLEMVLLHRFVRAKPVSSNPWFHLPDPPLTLLCVFW
jgi:hypothetical protein